MQKETMEVLSQKEVTDSLCKKEISFQLVQDVYARIKKKKEKKKKRYSKEFILTEGDLDQLFAKMRQLFEQYQIVASENSVSVFHQDDQMEIFSSIERFSLYNNSNNSPIKSVEVEYNYLINLPHSGEEKSYTVKIHIYSGICIFEEFKKDDVPMSIRNMLHKATGYLTIEYVDYVVANTIITTVDGWFDGLKEVANAKAIKKIQRFSKQIPSTFEYLLLIICLSNVLIYSSSFFKLMGSDNTTLSQWILFSFFAVIIAGRIGRFSGDLTYRYINTIVPLSRISINNGDLKLLEKYESENRYSLIKSLISAFSIIMLGILSNYSFNALMHF